MAKELTQLEIEEKALHSASKLFSEKGYDNVRMQDIAEDSGLPTADITKYYPLKKDLYDAIIHGMTKHKKAKIKKEITESMSSAKEILIDIIEKPFSDKEIDKIIPILASTANVPNAFAITMRNSAWNSIPLVSKIIQDGIEEGSFSTEFPDECAELFMLLINHWNEKHLLEYDLGLARRRYDFLQKLMRQLGVDIVTDNQVEKLVETSAKLYKAAARHGDNAKSA